jgi:hypothetical protein
MTGFGGRAFEFMGQPNKVYSLLSEKFHKVGAHSSHHLQSLCGKIAEAHSNSVIS